jgi:hypothetical protein
VRPAGIRVISTSAQRRRVRASVNWTLAGTGLKGSELSALQAKVEGQLAEMINKLPPGGAARQSRVSALLLGDPRMVDAAVKFQFEGETTESTEFTLGKSDFSELILPVQFATPLTEVASDVALTVKVSAFLPVHLVESTTAAQVSTVIQSAIDAHLSTRATDAPLTFDSLAAAMRDDSRFALLREDGNVTIEAGDRFLQLTDGLGEYRPAANEKLVKSEISIDVREGAV